MTYTEIVQQIKLIANSMVLISCWSFNLSIHTYNIIQNMSVTVALNEYAWLFIFLKGCYKFHPKYECILHSSSFNIYKRQNNKKGSKILLTFNMFNVFSFHNLGSRLFLTNMEI